MWLVLCLRLIAQIRYSGGSIRGLYDGNRTALNTYEYNAFGELHSSTGSTDNDYLFTGQQYDGGTGLYNLRARFYDPGVGRFLSEDPHPYCQCDPFELNRYVYTANSPINPIDPSGLFSSGYHLTYIPVAASIPPLNYTGLALVAIFALLAIAIGNIIWEYSKSRENEYTREALSQKTKSPCDYLADLYSAETDKQEKRKIRQAQKFLGCRNVQKRKK